jgi:ribonuclease T1
MLPYGSIEYPFYHIVITCKEMFRTSRLPSDFDAAYHHTFSEIHVIIPFFVDNSLSCSIDNVRNAEFRHEYELRSRGNTMNGLTKRLLLLLAVLIGFGGLLHCLTDGILVSAASAYRDKFRSTGHARQIQIIPVAQLPLEGRKTLKLIKQGGPFPYRKDGTTFQNREKRLPVHPRGYYKEYTVKTPGKTNRGARRIVAGSRGEFYYTSDHYTTFKRIKE